MIALAAASVVLSGCSVTSRVIWAGVGALLIPATHEAPVRVPRQSTDARLNNTATPQPPPIRTSIDHLQTSDAYRRTIRSRAEEVHPNFNLHIVEFDDNGVFWNEQAYTQMLACLTAEADPSLDLPETCKPDADPAGNEPMPDRSHYHGAIVVLFAHGWKHNCEVCDENLRCFRETLELIARNEESYPHVLSHAIGNLNIPGLTEPQLRELGLEARPRRVIGVYLGWRGESLKTFVGQQVSFWGRKDAAEAIGLHDAKRLVDDLDHWETSFNKESPRRANGTRLVMVGHSFGADVLFQASTGALQRQISNPESGLNPDSVVVDADTAYRFLDAHFNFTDAQRAAIKEITAGPLLAALYPMLQQKLRSLATDDSRQRRVVNGLGNLLVLVNPAFEASEYWNFNEQARRQQYYSTLQTPVLLTVSSDGDWATGLVFPFGRFISTVAHTLAYRDPAARAAARIALGHYEPFVTHRLADATAPGTAPVAAYPGDPGPCQCPIGLRYYSSMITQALATETQALVSQFATEPQPPNLHLADSRDIVLGQHLTRYTNMTLPADRDAPFMLVTTPKSIIDDHNDIFNARFISFLVEYVSLEEVKLTFTKELVPARSAGTLAGQ